MEPIFNDCGEFPWTQEGPVSQIHSHHLVFGAPEIFSDLLRYVQMSETGVQKSTESYRTYSISCKTAALVADFAVEDMPSAELQFRYLRLQWKTCPWTERSNDDDDDDDVRTLWQLTCPDTKKVVS